MQTPATTTARTMPAIAVTDRASPALRRLFRQVAAAALATGLVACGGGGGGDSGPPAPVPPPPPAPTPVTLPAVLSVPDPVGYDANRLAAFQRLNEIRLGAGLGLLAQDTLLDQAAQAHAEWEVTNDLYQHEESAGTQGFTGEMSYEREKFQGYAVGGPGSEAIAAGYAPRQAVDALVNGLYHRELLLDFSPVDIGIGWSVRTSPHVWEPLVLEFARPADKSSRAYGQTAQTAIGGILLWPGDGATGVLTHMGAENPNPVPATDPMLLGTPASLSVDYWKSIGVTNFTINEESTGANVPVAILTYDSDPNLHLSRNFVGAIPTRPLTKNTKYHVHFSGTIAIGLSADSEPFSRDWTFATGELDYPPVGP